MRFLHIKRAYVVDPTYTFEVERDVASNISLLNNVYSGEHVHDVCAISEEGEWLMHGRKIEPAVLLQLYSTVFVYIHSPNESYDRAFHMCEAHAQKYVLIYKATDIVLHHAARLEALIKTHALKVKFAHQIHLNMNEHNEDSIPSEVIAGKHIRSVFLPVHVISSSYRTQVPGMHTPKLAHDYDQLVSHLDNMRHSNSDLALRSHIEGDSVFVASLPNTRGEKIYASVPLSAKVIHGSAHFQTSHLPYAIKKEITTVVQDVSKVLFPKTLVVYNLQVHPKRGVFIQSTSPFYYFILHNPDFLFELANTHGIEVAQLFESVL